MIHLFYMELFKAKVNIGHWISLETIKQRKPQGEKLKKIKVQIEIAPQALGVKTWADHVTPDIYLIRYLK